VEPDGSSPDDQAAAEGFVHTGNLEDYLSTPRATPTPQQTQHGRPLITNEDLGAVYFWSLKSQVPTAKLQLSTHREP
jgi:hypothetical protein